MNTEFNQSGTGNIESGTGNIEFGTENIEFGTGNIEFGIGWPNPRGACGKMFF